MSEETKHDNVFQPGDDFYAGTFPVKDTEFWHGFTARQHAAIELRVPDSGLDWLDAMIEKRNLMDFAGQALQGLIASNHDEAGISFTDIPGYAYDQADAMIAEKRRREGGG